MTCFPRVSLRNRQLFMISNPNPVKVTHPIPFKSRSHFQPWSNSHDLHLSFPYHSYQGIRINHTMEPKVPPPQSLSLLQTDPRRRWSHRQSPHHGLREIWNWLNQNYKRVLLNPTPYSLETKIRLIVVAFAACRLPFGFTFWFDIRPSLRSTGQVSVTIFCTCMYTD